ncbi:pilus assembly protein PilY [Psychrobacter sp.]|uniref:pilus assembly protein PilY n=1 Tax=Psychrobacter sp. TaxID=56811 RepID=UPI003C72C55F
MKNLQNNSFSRRTWPIKALAVAVVMGLTGTMTQAANVNRKPIGDLEIYAPAKPGTASIFMMLDTSGSMSSYDRMCSGSRSERDDKEIRLVVYERKKDASEADGLLRDESGNTVLDFTKPYAQLTYTPYGCTDSGDRSKIATDRMTRLKMAIIQLVADRVYNVQDNSLKDAGSLPDNYSIGMGNYSRNGDGTRAVILTPTRELTAAQRVELIRTVGGLTAGGSTPTSHALAESGAYMMGTTTKDNKDKTWWSGFDYSDDSTKNNDNYISPLSDKECSGNGIYLLTDGEPNGSSDSRSKQIMNNTLSYSSSLSVGSCDGLSGGSYSGAWGCMADYAALLRNTANNPKGLSIKTATVGFGKAFDGLTGSRSIVINGKPKEVTDCDSGNVNDNIRNLCKLGERKGDDEVKTFGDGGFYYTEESADIAASIVDFASGLVQIISTAPSGTITIPEDPYRAANQLPYAYLPMLDPNIASAASTWGGNLKKYELDKGTLFGNNSKLLYKDVAGNLDEKTQDIWQTSDFKVEGNIANNNITAGGVYAQLKSPSSGLRSLRTLYVEDYTSKDSKIPTLRKVSVDGNGKPQGFDKLVDTVAYSQLNQRRLLSFLGFNNVLTNDGQPTSATEVKNLVLTRPTNETKVLGGVVHSKPEAVSYSATLDDNGRITDTRDDYVLFGSMDGALHLVDADDGKEEVAIIPKYMLTAQPEALVDGSIRDRVGEPYFGVDAPWLVVTDYNYDLAAKRVKVDASSGKGMFAYGGLRMGGEAFYGMDITNKATPKVMFTLTPEGRNNATGNNDFARLGQIWSKPTAAKIRLKKDADPINVLVFGGGYDMQYEDDSYVPTASAPAKGNAIYMINAQTGELLWSTSGESGGTKNTKTDKMINSMVGGITVLDRDNDGLMDHLYAADLGGQVFRADFENARPEKFGFEAVTKFSNKRVTRVLNSKPSGKPAYRFYERPVVSFYRNQSTGSNNGQLFALVNVISGNRSAPLSTLRSDNAYANRVYGIIDNDVTNADLYKSDFTTSIKDITESKLTNLATALGSTPNEAAKIAAKSAMVEGTKQGWYYPLTRFDGYNNVRYNKGVGDSVVINNLLYTTVYNPDKLYGTVPSCSAKISGGSERQLYCLPYGVCMEASSGTGTGGYLPAGQGIQELTLGAYNEDNTDLKVLIGNRTITERALEINRAGYGTDTFKNDSNIKDLYPGEGSRPTQVGGDGTAGEYIFNERYTMQPRIWYERK